LFLPLFRGHARAGEGSRRATGQSVQTSEAADARSTVPEFTHLHLHTEYSLLDGLSRIPEVMRRAKELGMSAVALTDHGALYGAIDFYTAAKDEGLKPILGVEAYLAQGSIADRKRRGEDRPFHLVLLAKDNAGYKNLMQLVTRAHLDGYYYKPRIDRELLAKYHKGLICLSACASGPLARPLFEENYDEALQTAQWFRDLFGPEDFYVELQRHDLKDEERVNRQLIAIGRALDLKIVATNDVHYVRPEDAEAQDVLVCIQTNTTLSDPNRMRMETPTFYLRSPQEMAALFHELPQALRSTMEIAEKCNVTLDLKQNKRPRFDVPEGYDADSYLRHLCEEGLRRLYPVVTRELRERLDYELGVIAKMGYSAYFLIVQDFVNWARNRGIRTAVRGSAPGSLACYTCGITEVDPIKYNLIFDRFLNTERYTMPDIDVDFMDRRRDEVIQYVTEKYGADHVAQIITFGTMKARAAVRDVGRALGMSYAEVDRVAKLIPSHPGLNITIADALEQVPELRELQQRDPAVARLLELAQKVEGIARHVSTHAAGVVISHEPLEELVPLQKATEGDGVMTQFEMGAIEKIGLLKMDFLGLSNLTILDDAVKLIERRTGKPLNLKEIPLDDQKTFELLSRGDTFGVFQLEGAGMTRYLKELKPTGVEDLMAMVALFRPGPMANIPRYIARKHGLEPVTYAHSLLEPVLKKTYGVMVYQEDIMTIAQAMGGFTLAEADVLCYAVRKKVASMLPQQKQKFVEGARKKGVPDEVIEQVWADFEPFARYGFNQAHAAVYGLLAYQTAYLKANYPVEYMTAVLSIEAGNTEKVAGAIAECRKLGVPVLPPDINTSEMDFTVEGDAIRFGLKAIKNVGEAAIQKLLQARAEGGPFTGLDDLCRRVDQRALNKRALESLIKAGALDRFGTRAALLEILDKAMAAGQREQRAAESGQASLFSLFSQAGAAWTGVPVPDIPEVDRKQKLAWEKELLGACISEDPFSRLPAHFADAEILHTTEIHDLLAGQTKKVAGIVVGVRFITTRKGDTMAYVTLEDRYGSIEVVVFPRILKQTRALWQEDTAVIVTGKVDNRDETPKLIGESAIELTEEMAAQAGAPDHGATVPRVPPLQNEPYSEQPREDWLAQPAPASQEPSPTLAPEQEGEREGASLGWTAGSLDPWATNGEQNGAAGRGNGTSNRSSQRLTVIFTRTGDDASDEARLLTLSRVFQKFAGSDPVLVQLVSPDGHCVRLALEEGVQYCDELQRHLVATLGDGSVLVDGG
jgi:DNA polymerase-3 subunit alpha